MKILLSNDDGYQAPGIVALHEAIRDLGEVEVVAPEHNNSAKSNALTLHAPLYVNEAASVMLVAPVIALFFFAQRTFIEGISTTGLKG